LKWGQKICPNLLIKKKIAQLINGKSGKKPLQQTARKQQHKNATSKPTSTRNQQPKMTTHRAPQRKEDPHNRQPS
jgi:hypothetical protein